MPKSRLFALSAAGLWYLLTVALGLHLSAELQLVQFVSSLALLIALLVSLFVVAQRWRALVSYIPLASCVLVVLSAPPTIRLLEPAAFLMRSEVLQGLEARAGAAALLPGARVELPLSADDRDFAYSVIAERTTDGNLVVSVATEGGFPVLHAGYVYSSSGSVAKTSEAAKTWPILRPVSTYWFRARD